MEWKEVEERLIRYLGANYFNYPQCVEWNIMIMKYIDNRKKIQTLEKVENGN